MLLRRFVVPATAWAIDPGAGAGNPSQPGTIIIGAHRADGRSR